MPLSKGKSEKTFEKNLKTELENGKPMKQSLAIAYAMKKKSKGGEVKGVHKSAFNHPIDKEDTGMSEAGHKMRIGHDETAKMDHKEKLAEMKAMPNPKLQGLDEGGPVLDPTKVQGFIKGFTGKADGGMMDDDDLVMKIMKKRYSEGGQVANDVHQFEDESDPNQFDDLVLDDNLEADYAGSNEHGDEKEKDDGIVGKIMSKRRKDRNPRPA